MKTKEKLAEKIFVVRNTRDYKIDKSKTLDRLQTRIVVKTLREDLEYLRDNSIEKFFFGESPY